MIEAQSAFCQELVKTDRDRGFKPERLIELYCNISRRMKLHQYDDATARLYRAFEYTAQLMLWRGFEIDTGGIRLEQIEQLSRDERLCDKTYKILSDKASSYGGRVKLGLRDAIELLAELNDPIGVKLVNMYWKNWCPEAYYEDLDAGTLEGMLRIRNQSWLAHGTKPIEAKTAQKLFELFRELLDTIYIDDKDRLDKLMSQIRFIKV